MFFVFFRRSLIDRFALSFNGDLISFRFQWRKFVENAEQNSGRSFRESRNQNGSGKIKLQRTNVTRIDVRRRNSSENRSAVRKCPRSRREKRNFTHRQWRKSDGSNSKIFRKEERKILLENFQIADENEFLDRLKSENDEQVKTISILGNTGDGKSFTLNKIFFDGEEIFKTSATADSCTMGAWAALEKKRRTLVFDTEGRLGLSTNDNVRNRLLLKIFSLSDVVIYRTRASKLPNDMFRILSDASKLFRKHFLFQLQKIFQPIKILGPTLIIFHETQHTGVLKGKKKSSMSQIPRTIILDQIERNTSNRFGFLCVRERRS